MTDSTVWLISGCSTGFGRALADAVLKHGQQAVITARDPATLQDFADRYPKQALVAALDVTHQNRIDEVVRLAEDRFGRIDVLVNNAGYGYLAAVEEGENDEVRAMFETNLFGLVALTKAVLPTMRRQRKGHVVNISSVGGVIGFPGVGYYNATKFAVEGFSEALAKEAGPLGIRVTIVEPGPFRTDWAGRNLRTPKRSIEDYASTAGARRAMISGNSGKQPGDPVRAAHAIIEAVESANPPLHLPLGRPAYDAIKAKVQETSSELEKWRSVILGADFPADGS